MIASFNDIRQAWRNAVRKPGFLVLAAVTLALGIGASVTVVGLVDRVLLRPLPYPEPGQLVSMGQLQSGDWVTITPEEYRALDGLDGVRSMGLASMQPVPVNIADASDPELVQAYTVDTGFLDTLSPSLALGRNFLAAEDVPGGARAVIISHALWLRRFQGTTDVIGRSLPVEGMATPIIGVLPADFRATAAIDLMLPMALPASTRDNGRNFLAIARLAGDASPQQVSSMIDSRLHALYAGTESARFYAHARFAAESLSTALGAQSRPILMIFLASALCVLVLAATNLTNLMVLRSISGSHVAAVRQAIGASTMRLATPMLAEGMLVGVVGAVLGLALAKAGMTLAAQRIPSHWFGGDVDVSLGGFAYGFAFVSAVIAALLAAVLGVWRGRTGDGARQLVAGGRSGLGRGAGRLTRALVVIQVALAVILLMGAALFARSLQDMAKVDLGYRTDGLLGFEIAPVQALYPDADAVKRMTDRIVERTAAMPGVRAATGGTNLPIGAPLNFPVAVPGKDTTSVEFRGVTHGFFDAFAIPILAGRDLGRADTADAAPVAIVNASFARMHLDIDQAATGAAGLALDRIIHVPFGDAAPLAIRIVGVVGDTRQHGPEQLAPPMVYMPFNQLSGDIVSVLRSFMPLRFALRVEGDPATHIAALRAALAEVAPGQPIANLRPVDELVRESVDGTRLNLLLIGAFAGLALLLSAVGLYAVIAVAASARHKEFGVRAAIGARSVGLLALVLGDGFRQMALGLVIGIPVAIALSHVLRGMFASIVAGDGLAVTAVVTVVVAVTLVACLIPAMRAARISPMRALRDE